MISLVTGGSGFIGSHLCEYLLNLGDTVLCLDDLSTSNRRNIKHLESNNKFRFIYSDVRYPIDVICDRIFHLACPASPLHYQSDPVRTIDICFNGTKNMLDLARKNQASIVITSTSEVYGDPEVHPQSELYYGNVNPVGPRSSYDEGKRAAEALAVAWRDRFNLDVKIARLFNCYGPQMSKSDGRLIPNLVCQALKKDPLTIYGDGNQTRSLCYVRDTVQALYLLGNILSKHWEVTPIMNIGNPEEYKVIEIAEQIRDLSFEITGNRSDILFMESAPEDPRRRRPDISLAKSVLDWEPTTSFKNGLNRTMNWFKDVSESSP